jgi:hypothetical protein
MHNDHFFLPCAIVGHLHANILELSAVLIICPLTFFVLDISYRAVLLMRAQRVALNSILTNLVSKPPTTRILRIFTCKCSKNKPQRVTTGSKRGRSAVKNL